MHTQLCSRVPAIKFDFYKMLLWLFVICSCCFRLTQQQSEFPGISASDRENVQSTPTLIRVNQWLRPGQELVFSKSESPSNVDISTASPMTVFINNVPVVATIPPFIAKATTPTPQFLTCFQRCPTTPEYNPICASNRQLYSNEQKFNCAKRCGADIQIVRRGSCEGLLNTRG